MNSGISLRTVSMTALIEKLGDKSKKFSLEAFEHSMDCALNVYFDSVAEIKTAIKEVEALWGNGLELEIWNLEKKDSEGSIDVSSFFMADLVLKLIEQGATFEDCIHFSNVINESSNEYNWENVKELTESRFICDVESSADYAKSMYKVEEMDNILPSFINWEELGNFLINSGDHELLDGKLYANS